jgi:hypothetical protein
MYLVAGTRWSGQRLSDEVPVLTLISHLLDDVQNKP